MTRSCSTSAPTTRPRSRRTRRLGYAEHARFEERLVRRSTSPWADLTAPDPPPVRARLAPAAAAAASPTDAVQRRAPTRPTTIDPPPTPSSPDGRPPRGPPMTDTPRTVPHDVTDLSLAAEGVRRIEWAEREMPVLRLIRERFEREQPAGRAADRRLPPRHDRDREPDADAQGGRRGRPPRGLEPAVDPGRDRGRARRRVRDRDLRPPGRGQRDTYYSHLRTVADIHPQITMDDGCDLVSLLHKERRDQLPEILAGTEETTTGVIRLARDGRRRRARVPGRRGQRGRDEAPVRQPLRDRPVDDRRDPARDQHPHRRPQRRHRRLRLGGQGHRVADGRARRARRGDRGQPGPRDRGADGRLPGHDRRRGGGLGRPVRDGDRQRQRLPPRALRLDEGRRDHGQLRPLRRRAGPQGAARDGRGPRPRRPPERPGVRPRRQDGSTSSPRAGS